MFWNNNIRLAEMRTSSKMAITGFLLIAGIGYLFGVLTIALTYSPVDEKPGMSINDIRFAYYGKRSTTTLEKAIDGSMRQYFQSDADYESVKSWLAGGAKESEFQSIKAITDVSCSTCHSKAAKVADVVTEDYADMQPLLAMDMGKSASRLVSLSHTHLLATLPLLFLMTLVFSFTGFSEGVKTVVMGMGFLALIADIGSWWIAKAAPWGAGLIVVGGAALGLSFGALIVLPLYDMWLKKT